MGKDKFSVSKKKKSDNSKLGCFGISYKPIFLMGLLGIKRNPIRFTITIMLFVFTLILFGLGYSAGDYDIENEILDIIYEQQDNRITIKNYSPDGEYKQYLLFSEETADIIISKLPGDSEKTKIYSDDSNEKYIQEMGAIDGFDYGGQYSGFISSESEVFSSFNCLYGRAPENRLEIAITLPAYESFVARGYYRDDTMTNISKYSDLVGKTISVQDRKGLIEYDSIIVGIYDTGLDYESIPGGGSVSEKRERTLGIYADSYHMAIIANPRYISELFQSGQDYALFLEHVYPGTTTTQNSLAVSYDMLDSTITPITFIRGYSEVEENQIIVPKSLLIDYLSFGFVQPPLSSEDYMNSYIEENEVVIKMEVTDNFSSVFTSSKKKSFIVVGYWDDQQGTLLKEYPFIFFNSENLLDIKEEETGKFIRLVEGHLTGNREEDLLLLNFQNGDGSIFQGMFEVKTNLGEDYDSVVEVGKEMRILGLSLSALMAIFSFLMIALFLSHSIISRKKEIGALRALGANNKSILSMSLVEGLMMGIISTIVSIGLLFLVAFSLNNYVMGYSVVPLNYFKIGFEEIISVIGMGFGFPIVFSLIPYIKYSKMSPSEMIR
jgi:ABC-type antimicrobial peptide transport system permease subunit